MNKILIIDDDRELCALIKRSVQAENIEADFCNTGKEGLHKLREQEYQLVVLDVMMPGMDGFETFGADVKAEPFKLWLAQVGRERIEETIDPEQAIDRALETYQKRDMIQTGFISGFFLSVSVMSLPLNGRSEAYSRAKNI